MTAPDDYDCNGTCPNCAPDAVPYIPVVPPTGRAVVDGWEFFYENGAWTWDGES